MEKMSRMPMMLKLQKMCLLVKKFPILEKLKLPVWLKVAQFDRAS
jgi:hypothetical protein